MAVKELYDSHEVTINRTGVTAKRVFSCAWSERMTSPDLPSLGDAYPQQSFGGENLRVVNIRIIPEGQSGDGTGGIDGAYTRARVEYDYALLSEDNVIITHELSVDALELGAGSGTWKSDSNPIDIPLYIRVPMLELTVEGGKSSFPLAKYLEYLGKVNSTTWQEGAPGTVLFEGASSRSEWDAATSMWRYRITLRFLYNPNGHNKAWRPSKNDYDEPTRPLYDLKDFNAFFVWEVA